MAERHWLRQGLGNPIVQHTGAEQRKLELVVRSPRNIIAVVEEVRKDAGDVDARNSVALP
jgi:hypothetical protein